VRLHATGLRVSRRMGCSVETLHTLCNSGPLTTTRDGVCPRSAHACQTSDARSELRLGVQAWSLLVVPTSADLARPTVR
jgi:hypothetical protein